MIKRSLKIGIIGLMIFMSCNRSQDSGSGLQVIDIESNIDKMEIVKLSQFTDNIRYVPLETKDDIFFVGRWEPIFSDSLVLARDLNKCVLFNLDGRYISIIGKNGRGPGEYYNLKCADFGADSNIFIQGNMNLYKYGLDGSFIKQYDNIFRINKNTYNDLNRWIFLGDSLLFGHIANSSGQAGDKALIINERGDVKYRYKNYILLDRKKPVVGYIEDFAHIIKFDDNYFYKELFNDTLFLLDDKLNLLPRNIFNLGKYGMSTSDRALSIRLVNYEDYIKLYEVFQTGDFLFLRVDFGKWFPARRLTPMPNLYISGGEPIWLNTVDVLGIYNKQTKELIFCKPTDTDNPLFTTGLYNDIDCGPRFFPSEQVNDSTMVMKVEVKRLKEHIASDDFKNGIPKYPEKKKKLEELAENLTDYDNPVLMFVTFRK
jgi:hypothetical protein